MAKLKRAQLEQMYDYVGEFSEGLAPARKDGKWLHIRTDGMPAYEERYDWVGHFRKGKATTIKGKAWYFISPDGTIKDEF